MFVFLVDIVLFTATRLVVAGVHCLAEEVKFFPAKWK